MAPIRSVTVYCSSSRTLDQIYYRAGELLGGEIARAGWDLVYGGNRVGLMQAVADGARGAGGRVIGITPQLFVDQGYGDSLCDELIVTENLRDRKAMLEQRGDAFIALPGGLGTFEEIFDIITHRQLGYHDKPIVLVNINGYYDALIDLIERGVAEHFIKIQSRKLFITAPTIHAAICHLRHGTPSRSPRAPELIASSAAE